MAAGAKYDVELGAEHLRDLVEEYKKVGGEGGMRGSREGVQEVVGKGWVRGGRAALHFVSFPLPTLMLASSSAHSLLMSRWTRDEIGENL